MVEEKHIMRRFIAKLADQLFSLIFVTIMASIIVLVATLVIFVSGSEIIDQSLSATEMAEKMMVSIPFTVVMGVIVHLAYYAYFGLIGKKTHGSLGKYMMNLRIRRRDNKSLKAWQLYIREPLVITNLITLLVRVALLTFGQDPLLVSSIGMALNTYFLVMLFLKRDVWNNAYIID